MPSPTPFRRILGLVLLLLLSAPLISPLFALTSVSESNLPACCRRNGAHHCAAAMQMQMQMESRGAGPSLAPRPERCPAYPQPSSPIPHTQLAAPAAALIFAETVSHPAAHAQTQAIARIAQDRSRQKRGPPTLL